MNPASDLALARAVDDLRRGEIVRIMDGAAGDASAVAIDVLAAELATEAMLARLERHGRAALLLTPERAATLHIDNQRTAAGSDVVVVERLPWQDLLHALATADPADDLETPLKGPFRTRDPGAARRAMLAALKLAKRAAILPALFAAPATGGDAAPATDDAADRITADAGAILGWRRAPRLRIVSRARLPLIEADDTEILAFRPLDGGPEHMALVIGQPGTVPLVRLHSACMTGDVLGSLRCDCGPQLRAAARRLAEEGGILLYLQQEGRGIGLLNKLRAYHLQDQGFDTVDANIRLGFRADERDFDLAAAMLTMLGVRKIRLLSNNPAKKEALESLGIDVAALVPHKFGANPHNRHYLATKRDRQGHKL